MKNKYDVKTIKANASDKEIIDAFEGINKAFIEIDPHKDIIKIYYPKITSLHIILAQNICDGERMYHIKNGKKIGWKEMGYYDAQDFLLAEKLYIKFSRWESEFYMCKDIGRYRDISKIIEKLSRILKCKTNALYWKNELRK